MVPETFTLPDRLREATTAFRAGARDPSACEAFASELALACDQTRFLLDIVLTRAVQHAVGVLDHLSTASLIENGRLAQGGRFDREEASRQRDYLNLALDDTRSAALVARLNQSLERSRSLTFALGMDFPVDLVEDLVEILEDSIGLNGLPEGLVSAFGAVSQALNNGTQDLLSATAAAVTKSVQQPPTPWSAAFEWVAALVHGYAVLASADG